jgi:23S rRNA (pseudouridine1915-N3)-methyltransferase
LFPLRNTVWLHRRAIASSRYTPIILRINIISIANRERSGGFDSLAKVYLDRLAPYTKCEINVLRSEDALWDWAGKIQARTSPMLVLLDSRGQQFSSEQFARWLANQRDAGLQNLVIAIGPADGWSPESRAKANLLLSLGAMTMPHELVRVVVAEQLYRAFTILAGHPYHSGH